MIKSRENLRCYHENGVVEVRYETELLYNAVSLQIKSTQAKEQNLQPQTECHLAVAAESRGSQAEVSGICHKTFVLPYRPLDGVKILCC